VRSARYGLVALLVCLMLLAGPMWRLQAQAGYGRLLYFAFPREQPAWLLPVRVVLVEGASSQRDVLEALCRGPQPGKGVVDAVLPRGTRVERLSVAGGTATVDLQLGKPEPQGNRVTLAAQAIVHSLSQFPQIAKVVVRVGGQPWPRAGSRDRDTSGLHPDPHLIFAGFPDLEGEPRDGAILALALRGVFTGYPDGSFRSSLAVSRAEAVKSLVEALPGRGLPVGMAVAPSESDWFSDVPRGHWVLPYLREAVRKGIVPQPGPEEEFSPDAPLDGATLVRWLYRVAGPVAGGMTGPQGCAEPGGDAAGASQEEAEAWLVSQGILDRALHSWAGREAISRGDWALMLARMLRLGGPDLYLVSPVSQESLEGEVLVTGAARWPDGQVTVALLDSRGRELAARVALVSSGKAGTGWGWFAEWLHFPRPLTSSAGIVQVSHLPPRHENAAGVVVRIPVFIR